jgi:hypothetical protein
MPSQSIVLLPQTSSVGDFVSAPQKGDGYYNLGDGLHTAVLSFSDFVGTVSIQATLAISPTENDWFDVDSAVYTGTDSEKLDSSQFVNFQGNFVWVRAKGTLIDGTVTQIRYNH